MNRAYAAKRANGYIKVNYTTPTPTPIPAPAASTTSTPTPLRKDKYALIARVGDNTYCVRHEIYLPAGSQSPWEGDLLVEVLLTEMTISEIHGLLV